MKKSPNNTKNKHKNNNNVPDLKKLRRVRMASCSSDASAKFLQKLSSIPMSMDAVVVCEQHVIIVSIVVRGVFCSAVLHNFSSSEVDVGQCCSLRIKFTLTTKYYSSDAAKWPASIISNLSVALLLYLEPGPQVLPSYQRRSS